MNKLFLPTQLKDYYTFFQVPARRWWFALIGLIGTLVLVAGYAMLFSLMPDVERPENVIEGAWQYPLEFLAGNLFLGGLIVVAILASWIFYRQGFGWLSSVVGRFRWKWFSVTLAVFGIGFLLNHICAFLLLGMPAGIEGLELAVRPYTALMIIVILLATPFQAAGEEYFFRGMIGRLVAAAVPFRKAGLILSCVISTLFFMTLHNDASLTNNLLYITMGLACWWLAYRTGGIEASIALHTLQNIVGRWSIPFINFAELPERADNGVFSMILEIVFLIILTLIIDLLARRRGLVRMSSPSAEIPEVVKTGKMVIDIASSAEPATKDDLPRFDTTVRLYNS